MTAEPLNIPEDWDLWVLKNVPSDGTYEVRYFYGGEPSTESFILNEDRSQARFLVLVDRRLLHQR
jgi:hypothetical protein